MENQAPRHSYHALLPNGDPCIVIVRTDLAEEAPLEGKPVLCSVALAYQGDEHGLPNEADAHRLQEWVEKIIDYTNRQKSGIWVGSITSANRRVIFFYSGDADVFHKTNAAYLNSLSDIPFLIGGNAEKDSEWLFYRKTLLPNRQMQAFGRNQSTIDAMLHHGDDPERLRPIHHYAYFDNPDDAQAFAQAAGEIGNYLHEIAQSADHAEVFRVKLTHVGRIHADKMAETAANLEELAEQHHGQYDDWEALLAKRENSTTETTI